MLARKFLAVAVFGFLCASGALADDGYRGRGKGHWQGRGHARGPAFVSARVVDVEPLVRYVTVNRPREECWNEYARRPVRRYGVAGPTLAGSVVGAAIGRQFGSGNDRDALTVLGAVAGGAVAHRRALDNGAGITRDVAMQRCEVVHDRVTEQIVDGYLVTSRYDGRNYRMQTERHPCDFVQVAVDVRPVGYRVRY